MKQLLAIDADINGIDAASVNLHSGMVRVCPGVAWQYLVDGIASYMNNVYPKGTGASKIKPVQFANKVYTLFQELQASLDAGNAEKWRSFLKDVAKGVSGKHAVSGHVSKSSSSASKPS